MSTTCKECGRVVMTAHVDGSGMCVFCAKPPAVEKPAPAKHSKD